MVAKQLEKHKGLEQRTCGLVYVPAAQSPHKTEPPTADEHRIAMLNIALQSVDRDWSIWTQELADGTLNPGAPSYWADTWAIANALLPDSMNRFLIGADQAMSMHRWHRYQEFWEDATVMMRDGIGDTDELIEGLDRLGVWTQDDLKHWRTCCVPVEMVPWSSSEIRQQLCRTDQQKNTRIEGLDPGVQSYILEHGLYR